MLIPRKSRFTKSRSLIQIQAEHKTMAYYTGDTNAIELSEPIPATLSLKVADQYEAKVPGWTADKRYTVSSGPIGLAIGLRTGTIRWTPTPNQVGTHPVTISDGAGGTMTFSIVVAANPAFTDDLSVFGWVANVGTGTGTLAAPAIDLRAFRGVKVGTTYNSTRPIVYLRGGTYPRGTDNRKMLAGERAVRDIDLNNVEIRAWGNERVTLRIGENPVRVVDGSTNVTIDGLEIRGDSDKYEYKDAIDAWWGESRIMNSNGFAIAGTGVTVRNCVVHEVMCQAIAFKGATDILAENNIIANSARWTISGTTGIGFVSNIGSSKPNTEQNCKMIGNLIWGVESRIYSHVFEKKYAHLGLDEGEALLLQPANITGLASAGYEGRFLVQNNCAILCGKGIVANTAQKVDVINNTILNVGTTLMGDAKGLRGNKASGSTWRNNLVQTFAGATGDLGSAYSFGHDRNAAGQPINGYIEPQFSNNWGNVDDGKESGMTIVPSPFANAAANDPTPHPSIPAGVGADHVHHLALMEKARSYSVNLVADPYWQTMDYSQQTKDVFDRLPAGLVADYSDWHNTVPYIGADGKSHTEFEVPITGDLAANGLPSPFKLIVTRPFARI